jgi:hypothetical protein
MANREADIQAAIRDLDSGVFTSQRQAAKAYNIPRSSLRHRLDGRQPAAIAHHQEQRLTPEQEEFLVKWILDEDSRANPPTYSRTREIALRVLRINSDDAPLS